MKRYFLICLHALICQLGFAQFNDIARNRLTSSSDPLGDAYFANSFVDESNSLSRQSNFHHISSTLINDAQVVIVYALSEIPATYGSETISARISNLGETTFTNLPVTLNISGANLFSNTKFVNLPPQTSALVTFDTHTGTNTGTNTVSVSIPTDDQQENNIVAQRIEVPTR